MSSIVHLVTLALAVIAPPDETAMIIENPSYRIGVEPETGAVVSFFIKDTATELISEPKLASNFRLCLPLEDYQANYIDGMKQTPVSVKKTDTTITARFSGLTSEKGRFDVDFEYTIALDNDEVRFTCRLTNNEARPVSELWFPRLGGLTRFGESRDAGLAIPGYTSCGHWTQLFKHFPGSMMLGSGFGAETAEWTVDYPGMSMPWWSLHDPQSDRSLYLGYHDTTCRLSTWHTFLWPNSTGHPRDSYFTPEQAKGAPIGLVFSHVRYPFAASGETFDSGTFVMRHHKGDWHQAAKYYRRWFMKHFPFDKSDSWLRKESAWFTSIIYQPEDRIVADYETYADWTADAQRFGINAFELIGWDIGGLERGYPQYEPEPKLGGQEGFRTMIETIQGRDGRIMPFVNYNILDSNTDLYREKLKPFTHQDTFGTTPNWMAWGESTLIARKGLSVRRHLLASVLPPLQELLEAHYVDLVEAGADGLQIDKLCASHALDFNPLATCKPDEAMTQALIDGVARVYEKCRALNPDFRLAGEATHDRMIPFIDVFYRAASGFDISPLRYTFPEWTACRHVGEPRDFNGVNAAVLTGAVLCVEPQAYQASLAHPLYEDLARYIAETNRIRRELHDTIFEADYLDRLGAEIGQVSLTESAMNKAPADQQVIAGAREQARSSSGGALHYRIHANRESGARAIVVVNASLQPQWFTYRFIDPPAEKARLVEPYRTVVNITPADVIRIPPDRFQVIVEQTKESE